MSKKSKEPKQDKILKKLLKKNKKSPKFSSFFTSLEQAQQQKLLTFFRELDNRLFMLGSDKKKIKIDFQRAFVEYSLMGISLERSLELLDLSNLGGFYSRASDFWLPLDEVGKSYTQFLDRRNMAVFREAFYLKDRIHPELLQIALNFTIKRFPYFAMSVRNGVFWHYLDSTRRRFAVEKDGPIPVQRIRLAISGSKTFRVLFYENRISVEFFHCLTDGTGAREFLKSLTTTYLKLIDKKIGESNLVIDNNSVINKEEYENAYLKVKRVSGTKGYINKKALQLSGPLSSTKPCRVLHFRVPTDKLKEVSKKYEVGISAYLTTVMYFACKSAIDVVEGDVSVTLPVNMRKCYPSKTLRNFSLFTSLRKPINDIYDFGELCKETEVELKSKINKEKMIEMAGTTAGMMNTIRYIPLPLKIFGTKTLYKFLGDNIFTVALSNLGVCELPEDLANEIVAMDFILGTSFFNRGQVACTTVNNVTTMSISKYTKDPSFEEKMYDLLKKDGLDVIVEGSECYGN